MRPKIRQAYRGWQKDGSLFDGNFVSHGWQHSGINKRQLETLLAVSLIRHCTPPAHFDAIWLHINHVSLGSCHGRICTTSGDFQVGYLHVNCQRSETYKIKKTSKRKNVTTIKIVKNSFETIVRLLHWHGNRFGRPAADGPIIWQEFLCSHYINFRERQKWTKTQVEKNSYTVVNYWFSRKLVNVMPPDVRLYG